MDRRDFEEALQEIPRLLGWEDLPRDLREAAARDPALRRAATERMRLDRLLGELADERPPADLAERIVARALRGDRTATHRSVPWVGRIAAAAAVAALLAGAFLLRDRPDDGEGGAPRRAARGPTAAGQVDAPDPELLARLDLFLTDWEAVVEEGEALDVLAGLDAVRRLEALEEFGWQEPAAEDGG